MDIRGLADSNMSSIDFINKNNPISGTGSSMEHLGEEYKL